MSFTKRCLWVLLSVLLGLGCGYLALFLGLGGNQLLSRPNMEFALRAGALSGVLLSCLILVFSMGKVPPTSKTLCWLVALWMGLFTLLLFALAVGDSAA